VGDDLYDDLYKEARKDAWRETSRITTDAAYKDRTSQIVSRL